MRIGLALSLHNSSARGYFSASIGREPEWSCSPWLAMRASTSTPSRLAWRISHLVGSTASIKAVRSLPGSGRRCSWSPPAGNQCIEKTPVPINRTYAVDIWANLSSFHKTLQSILMCYLSSSMQSVMAAETHFFGPLLFFTSASS